MIRRKRKRSNVPGPTDPVLAAEVNLAIVRAIHGGPDDLEALLALPDGPVWNEVSRQFRSMLA